MGAEGDEIRRERRSRKMSQKELSAATGVGLRTITRIETGESEREGKDADSRSLTVLQRYLRVGPFKPAAGQADDPPLSQATFSQLFDAVVSQATFGELLNALNSKHGQEMRDAVTIALNSARGASPEQTRPTRRGQTGSSGLITPRYDASENDDTHRPIRDTHPGAAG